jgi:6-pyruvoyltetrahydropterin/6-carboxytetrahydropterin synthase
MHHVSKTFRFESAHRLRHLPSGHKCCNIHGHSYRVEVICQGRADDDRGFVVDYASISDAVDHIIDDLDHTVLCDEEDGSLHRLCREAGSEVSRLPIQTTSAERLAEWLYAEISDRIDTAHQIRVDETCRASVVYPIR